jgi:hypothetical protein
LKDQEERFVNKLSEKMEQCKQLEFLVAAKEKDLQQASANIEALEGTCREKASLEAIIEDLQTQLSGEALSKVDLEARLNAALVQQRSSDAVNAIRAELAEERGRFEEVQGALKRSRDEVEETAAEKEDLVKKLRDLRHMQARFGTVLEKLKRCKAEQHKIRDTSKKFMESGGKCSMPERLADLDDGQFHELVQAVHSTRAFKAGLRTMLEPTEAQILMPGSRLPEIGSPPPSLAQADEGPHPCASSDLSDPPDVLDEDFRVATILRASFQSPDGYEKAGLPQPPTIEEEQEGRRNRRGMPPSILIKSSQQTVMFDTSQSAVNELVVGNEDSEYQPQDTKESDESQPQSKGSRSRRGRGGSRGRGQSRGSKARSTTRKAAPVRDRYTTVVKGMLITPDTSCDPDQPDTLAGDVVDKFHVFQEEKTRKRPRSQAPDAESPNKSRKFGELTLSDKRDDDDAIGDLQASPHFPTTKSESSSKSDPGTRGTIPRTTSNTRVTRTYSRGSEF